MDCTCIGYSVLFSKVPSLFYPQVNILKTEKSKEWAYARQRRSRSRKARVISAAHSLQVILVRPGFHITMSPYRSGSASKYFKAARLCSRDRWSTELSTALASSWRRQLLILLRSHDRSSVKRELACPLPMLNAPLFYSSSSRGSDAVGSPHEGEMNDKLELSSRRPCSPQPRLFAWCEDKHTQTGIRWSPFVRATAWRKRGCRI